jgi:Protein of unknown function (DUF4236)
MGLRFRKSIKVLPGVRLNLGLRGASLSFGGRGVTYNVGAKGSRVTLGIPGSGLSYSASMPHQAPTGLVANPSPAPRRLSAAPLVIVAFLFGLAYIAFHLSPSEIAAPKTAGSAVLREQTDTGSSIEKTVEEGFRVDGSIPIPRPRHK